MDVELKLEHAVLAVEGEHEVHLMVALTAPDAPTDGERQPLRIALVLDRSGSMHGQPLEAVLRCAAFLIDRLQASDELALIAYDDVVELLAPLAPIAPAGLKASLGAVQARGMTNLSAGWLKGVEELRRRDGDGLRRVLLLTDGHANEGITDAGQLIRLARHSAAEGITTTTLGFGDGFSEDLLTAMADAGRGTGHFIASVDDAPAAFASEFSDLVSLVAQNLSVEIRPSAAVEVVGVLNDHPAVIVDGGVQVQLGDAHAGQHVRVVARLGVPGLGTLGPAKVADVVVRWVGVGEQVVAHEVTEPLLVNLVDAGEAATAVPDAEVVEEVTVLLAARAVVEARRLAEAGEHEAASTVLAEAADALRRTGASSARADELIAHAAVLDDTKATLATGRFTAMASKDLHYSTRSLNRRRGGRGEGR